MNDNLVKLALPTGRIQTNFYALMADAGIKISQSARSYRPTLSIEGFEAKVLKSQNAVEMLALGKRDIGVAGLDWVTELGVELVQLLDTGLDPVRIVAAAPAGFPDAPGYQGRKLVVATEYVKLTERWLQTKGLDATVIRSFGTTEAFPPEDADFIVDNTSTGATIEASKLVIFDELLRSSTRLFANPQALENPVKRQRIEDFVLILKAVIDARDRVMIEANVSQECLEAVANALPCMRTPTISQLYGGAGYVVKAAVPKHDLPKLIPAIKQLGGTDIVVSPLSHVTP